MSIFARQDVVSEIVKFLPSCLDLSATCKSIFSAICVVGKISLGHTATKRYLEDVEFRVRANHRVLDRSAQMELNLCCIDWEDGEDTYCEWASHYASLLADVKTLNVSVSSDVAREIPWFVFQNILSIQITRASFARGDICRLDVIGELRSVVELLLSPCVLDFRGIENLKNLKVLRVSACEELRRCEFIGKLTKLEILEFHVDDLDLAFLHGANFTRSLRELKLYLKTAQDSSFLRKYTALVELSLFPFWSDLTVLANCTNLEDVSLSGCRDINLSLLTSFPKLKRLGLSSSTCSDFSCLANISSLESLCLSSTRVADISIFKQLPKLRSLSFCSTRVTDISSLPEFPALKIVSLRDCKIECYGPLFFCPLLESVYANIFKRGAIHMSSRS